MTTLTEDESPRLKRKRQFYELAQLIEGSDDEPDQAYHMSKRLLDDGLRKRQPGKDSITARKGVTVKKSSVILRAQSPAQPPPSAIPRARGKAKATEVLRLVPLEQQIFAGLQFYFFPSSDANPARRLRIIKSIEFGASWQKEYNKFVTHIIVDKDMSFDTLLAHLKLQSLPESVTLVNESWPADCLSHRALLAPDRSLFAVPGAPVRADNRLIAVAQQEAPTEQPASSDSSLILKPAGKAVQAASESTQRSSPIRPLQQLGVLENDALLATQDDSSNDLPLEFQQAISQARDLSSLPLEEHDDDIKSKPLPTSQASTISPMPGPTKKTMTYQDRFQCMQAHTGQTESGPNAEIVHILQQMADYHQQTGDEWRTRAYRKAVATIRKHKEKISTKEQAQALPNIGERLAEKIEEIAFTHRLRRLDAAQAEPADQTLSLFMKIYGVGYAQASKWVRKGCRTLDDLVNKEKLTYAQTVGIEHFEDFNLRIPRPEVKQHADTVLKALRQVDRSFELIVGGSYRRGSPDSGDIDCVITHPQLDTDRMRRLIIDKVIAPLTQQSFIKAGLSVFTHEEGSKWHGASCLPGSTVWRRLDLLLVQNDELGAAMIYFTGNDIFNRSMRLLASKKGMRLNQRGLYQNVIRGKGGERMTSGALIEGKDERKIFDILGVPWREPWERLI